MSPVDECSGGAARGGGGGGGPLLNVILCFLSKSQETGASSKLDGGLGLLKKGSQGLGAVCDTL